MTSSEQPDLSEYLNSLSPEERAYVREIESIGEKVESVLKKHPELDRQDLYQIEMRLRMSPDERLKLGLRRRVFGYVD